jgi:pilus assembly protein CpaC
VLALVLALALAAPDSNVLHVKAGAQTVLRVPGVSRVALGDQSVGDVTPTGAGELLVIGKRPGRTNLTLWVHGQVQTRTLVVEDDSSDAVSRMVHELVDPALTVRAFNEKIVVEGTVDSMGEMAKLRKLLGDDPRVVLLVRLDPRALPAMAEVITQALQRNGLRDAHATAIGSEIILEGTVQDEQEREKAQTIADSYYQGYRSSL